MTERRLENQRVLVAGGASGIGRQICSRLAHEGAQVWINYRSRGTEAESLQAELAQAGAIARLVQADVCDETQVAEMLAHIEQGGGVHSLVYAPSAPLKDKKFVKTDWAAFVRHWEVAVHGAYLLIQGLLALNAETRLESVVIILSSVTLGLPPVEKSPYVSAKYALLGLAHCLAVELAPKGVRVNCVSPGFTATGLNAGVDERIQELIARSVPLKRLCTPEEIASAVTFLLSAESAYVTGVNLPITGGLIA
jgi:NAD(P)-dependent dehydrogenase (short-subunit alcohol dehydrogenase family)